MSFTLEKTVQIDDDPDSYRSFYDRGWDTTIRDEVASSALAQIVFDLCTSWRGVANARRWPWLVTQFLRARYRAAIRFSPELPAAPVKELARIILGRSETYQLSISERDRESLARELEHIQSEMIARHDKHIPELLESLWQEFLGNEDFLTGVWKSEENAYVALYFAYEVFLIRCVKLGLGIDRLESHQLSKRLIEFVGEDCANTSWNDGPIYLAKLIRHAIAHNGGRVTTSLKKHRAKLTLQDDEIVILAPDTTELFLLLKDRALLFIQEAVKKCPAK